MQEVSVQDNFLDVEYFQFLKGQVLDKSFPWTVSTVKDSLGINDYQLCHGVCNTIDGNHIIVSTFYEELTPLFKSLDVLCCLRIKINLLKREEKLFEHPLHVDWANAPSNLYTSLLYFNTNNGYTRFEDGTKIQSVENRLITFPNHYKHSGTVNSCTEPHRCVMNINYFKKK